MSNVTFNYVSLNNEPYYEDDEDTLRDYSWDASYSPIANIFSAGYTINSGSLGHTTGMVITINPRDTFKLISFASTGTLSTNYKRISDNTYHNDMYGEIESTFLPDYAGSGPSDIHYVFIPGWRRSSDKHWYYGRNGYKEYDYALYYPDISYCTLISYEDDNDGMQWVYAHESNNYAGEITAPAGTYPDCGLSGGFFYIKQ